MNKAHQEINFRSGGHVLFGKLWGCEKERPTIIMLSGIGFHSFEYEQIGQFVAENGLNCLAFDFRGHGMSEGKRGRWNLQDLVDDTKVAVDFIEKTNTGDIVVFGNSLGAMIGLLAAINDRRIRGAVLSNCPARLSDFMMTPFRQFLFVLFKGISVIYPFRISINNFYSYSDLIDDPKWVDLIERDDRITDARKLTCKTFSSLLEQWDGIRTIKICKTPLLILQGNKDRLQPIEQSEALFKHANEPKEFQLVDTGHLPHLENPRLVSDLLRDWIKRILS